MIHIIGELAPLTISTFDSPTSGGRLSTCCNWFSTSTIRSLSRLPSTNSRVTLLPPAREVLLISRTPSTSSIRSSIGRVTRFSTSTGLAPG